ncbi:endoglucanase [Lachnoclostridium sp. An169]|uniref:chitobiase/beta-hexosaminidase C-terminal domain-containing protein n=1 Tax=Lachnoclostridium sp. An169 TaxID=1965569 RepID=UPI000B3A55AB|nr:chitobiase/beta-hexosaminidase C-terminal domain-containing protein [Lachnoclostridium sp. An169]OUP85510.1 endoglucanase [Lachnoclostridium sp. An169]HJA65766.1 chitobiase/beta-hexosaminidase C-terminal domain-containing protein [Candidatus Mediterraneibacter cottocaccae]
MRCTRCGANIPDDQMICPECGAEVQIVPDYNPLDDVLTREVRGSVEGATRQIQTDDIRKYQRKSGTQNGNSTRVLSQEEMDRLREKRREQARRSRNAGRNTELRRQQQRAKRLEAARRKRRNLLITLFVLLVLIVVVIYVAYINSYTGVMKSGYRALQERNYETAEEYFNRAVVKDRSRAEAYIGLSEIYRDQDDLDGAEDVFLTALESQPTNTAIYQAVIDFYMDTEQQEKISVLLASCDDQGVLDAVADYVSAAPTFSLADGTYEEVQEVSITSETGGTIYYTTDGTDPTTASTQYTEPILLQKEETTEIRAIAVNANDIPSVVSTAKYTIEFPLVDAPAVNPATGQYTEPTQITITVPEGYTAYYTTDGSTPTADSTQYTGPVDMPQNQQIIFSAVLINNNNGKATAVTTRNYISRID